MKKTKSSYQKYYQSIKKKNKDKKTKIVQNAWNGLKQKQQKIVKLNLKPGMIVKFVYRGINNIDPNPFVLILNDNWRGKTHGIALRNLSVRQVQLLMQMIKNKSKTSIFKRLSNIFKSKSDKIVIQNPRKFYYSAIKPFLRSAQVNCYRTYFYSRISNIKHISYKFQQDIWQQTAVQKQRVINNFQRMTDKEFYKNVKTKGDATQKTLSNIQSKDKKSLDQNLKALKDAGWI